MANGFLDEYSQYGDLGGQSLQDLYSTYTQFGYLMGSGVEGFEIGGEEFGLEQYDFTQENLLREKYREDFRDFQRSTADIYRFGKNLELAKHIYSSKSGFKKTLYQEMIDGEYKHQVKNINNIRKKLCNPLLE